MNISKTKVVIFSKGKVRRFPKFYLSEEEVDVAYDYVYLGVTFNYNGTFTKAMEKQINQARKAMFIVLEKALILNLPFDVICELYEKCVIPGGRFKNTYELLNQRALKFSYVNKIHIFQCMGKIFCVEFQRYPLKFHTKYLTHTLKDMIFMQF